MTENKTIYPPNTKDWKTGDIVIHDADAKEKRMLMRVIGITATGQVLTKYINEDTGKVEKVWMNDKVFLHDPSLFPHLKRKTIAELLDEFKADMIAQFEQHNDKYHDFSLDAPFEQLKATDEQTLRYEMHMHYAKWLYHGIHKRDIPETTTLVNAANVQFLLWVRLKLEAGDL